MCGPCVRRADIAIRLDFDVLEPAIDGNVLLRGIVEGVLGPLVVEPEECVSGHAVGDNDRRHLLPGVCRPVESARVHDHRTDLRDVDVSSGEVELVGCLGARRVEHSKGECLEVGGDGSIKAMRAEGKVNAAHATVWGLGDGADEAGLQRRKQVRPVRDRVGGNTLTLAALVFFSHLGSLDHCQYALTGSLSSNPAGKTTVIGSFEAFWQVSLPL